VSRAAPRLPWQLVEAIGRLDEPGRPVAETWRRACVLATELGVSRPSYEQIRRLVARERLLRSAPGLAGLALDVSFRARSPQHALDLLSESSEQHRIRSDTADRDREWRPDASS
jgi:hypothetical protein